MKKIIKITMIILLVFTIFGNLCKVNAAPTEGTDGTGGNGGNETIDIKTKDTRPKKSNWGDVFSLGEKFISEGKNKRPFTDDKGNTIKVENDINENDIQSEASSIFSILLAIGTVLTVIVGGILGIQFMFASIEDKAKIKEALIPYIVGCVVIFGADIIWFLVVNVLNNI